MIEEENEDIELDDSRDDIVNDIAISNSTWSNINTNNTFDSFELNDIVEAWYDDKYYTAQIIEKDHDDELFTLLFLDDYMEVDSYKAQWIKHLS